MKDIQGKRCIGMNIAGRESLDYSLDFLIEDADLRITQYNGSFSEYRIYIDRRDLAVVVKNIILFLDNVYPIWRSQYVGEDYFKDLLVEEKE